MKLTDEMIKKVTEEENLFKNMHTIRKNGLFLSDQEIEILERYNIHYEKYTNLMELVHDIDEVNEEVGSDELDQISTLLAEQNYYQNTRK